MNRLLLAALMLPAVFSCSRPASYYEFHSSYQSGEAGQGEYEFSVPFDESDASYATFLAFRFASPSLKGDSIPVMIKAVSPSSRTGSENVTFFIGDLNNARLDAEFPYRSNVRPASDTGLWRICVTVDQAKSNFVTGMGFRYIKTEK